MIGAMLSLLQEDGWILRDRGDVVSAALPCLARNGTGCRLFLFRPSAVQRKSHLATRRRYEVYMNKQHIALSRPQRH